MTGVSRKEQVLMQTVTKSLEKRHSVEVEKIDFYEVT